MTTPRASHRYTPTAMTLHWLLAVLIIGTFGLGVYMADLPFSMARLKMFNWHKWAGVTILALSAARLLWRLSHRPPTELPMPAWQRAASRGAHALLYLLFFAVPLVGWAYSSASGFPIVWFAMLPLPDFVPVNRELADVLKGLHGNLAWLLAGVVVLHVLAALKHHFVDRDGLLHRMWPARN